MLDVITQVALGVSCRALGGRADRGVDAVDVGEHHLLGVLGVAGLEPARVADAGVGEHDVDAAVGVERRARRAAPTSAYSRHVAADGEAADLFGERLRACPRSARRARLCSRPRPPGGRWRRRCPTRRRRSGTHGRPWLLSLPGVLADRAKIEVQAGRGGDGSMSFRRESRVPKGGPDGGDGGRGGDVVLRCDDSLRDLQSFRRRGRFKAERGGHGLGKLMSGADGDAARDRGAAGHQRRALGRPPLRPRAARPGDHDRPRRARRARQQDASPPPRGRRRGSPSAASTGRGGPGRAAPEAARRRRARRAAQRGQVVAAVGDDARAAEGRLLPVHDVAARAGHDRRRRPPARARRHPGADRGRLRGRRARPRLPRARRAHAAAGACPGSRAAGRLGPGAQLRGDRARAGRARSAARRAAAAAGACPRPISSRRRSRRPRPTSGARGSPSRCS